MLYIYINIHNSTYVWNLNIYKINVLYTYANIHNSTCVWNLNNYKNNVIYIYPIPPGPSSKVYPPKAKHVGIFLVISSIYFFCWTLVGLMPRLSRGSSGSSHSEITVRAWAVSLLKRTQPLGKSPTTSNNIPGFGWCMGMLKMPIGWIIVAFLQTLGVRGSRSSKKKHACPCNIDHLLIKESRIWETKMNLSLCMPPNTTETGIWRSPRCTPRCKFLEQKQSQTCGSKFQTQGHSNIFQL